MPEPQQKHEPHWAIAQLFAPGAELPTLKPGEEDRDLDVESVLMFPEELPGHLPRWFPDRWDGRLLTHQQRLEWFEESLERYGSQYGTWPPSGNLNTRKRQLARSFLHMYDAVEEGALPIPDLS